MINQNVRTQSSLKTKDFSVLTYAGLSNHLVRLNPPLHSRLQVAFIFEFNGWTHSHIFFWDVRHNMEGKFCRYFHFFAALNSSLFLTKNLSARVNHIHDFFFFFMVLLHLFWSLKVSVLTAWKRVTCTFFLLCSSEESKWFLSELIL